MLPLPVEAKLYSQHFYQTKCDGRLIVSSKRKRHSPRKL